MKKILAEQLAYGVDSCTVDMMTQTFEAPYTCWCDTCRKQFQAQYHRPMPNGVTWDEDWDRMLVFRYQSSQRFEQALREHVKSVNPKATIYFNYHGFPPFSFDVGQRPVQHAGIGDFVTGETGAWIGRAADLRAHGRVLPALPPPAGPSKWPCSTACTCTTTRRPGP